MQEYNFILTLKSFIHLRKQITRFDISLFLRQFATLISAGIPISKCFDILEKNQEKIALRHLIFTIRQEIRAGKSLFQTLRLHHRYFDELTCQLINIGEHTGKLDTMLNIIASHHEKHLALRSRIHQSLFYPCIISIVATLVTLSMFIFVIPRFAELFHDTNVKLPLLTQWLFAISLHLNRYGLWFLLFFICTIVILNKLLPGFTKLLTRLPFVTPIIHKIIITQFARNLAITYAAGISITEALKLAANHTLNMEFICAVAKLRGKVSAGLQLYHAMETLPFFPTLLVQMVKIGEESGMLAQMLDKVADFFTSEIEQLINRINQLLEPLIMLVLGVLIGVIMIGMYLPIFKLGSVL